MQRNSNNFILLIVITLFLIFIFLFFYEIKPRILAYASLRKQIQEAEIDLRKAKVLINSKNEIDREYNKYKANLTQRFENKEVEFPFIEILDRVITRSHLSVINIKSQRLEKEGHSQIQYVEVKARGNILHLINFLYNVNDKLPFLRTEQMRLLRGEGADIDIFFLFSHRDIAGEN